VTQIVESDHRQARLSWRRMELSADDVAVG
jgi:hypothetical protein